MVKENPSNPLVALAKEAVESYVRFGKMASATHPVPPEMETIAGVFICLKKHGQLRGCIGTIEPTQPSLAAEIVMNSVSAAVHDPRFEPVTEEELADLEYTVDVLGSAEAITGFTELDPKLYGVIVESGYKRGLLLPDLEGIDTVEEQVSIAMRKAGIYDGESVSLYRFQVIRHV